MRPLAPPPRFLEVELGTYCNRVCAWCPNGWHDRGQERRSMAPSVWRGLLEDLGAWRYRGLFAFHNYNEPMADEGFFTRLAEARAALPLATLDLHTNGDFLTPTTLEALRVGGLNLLQVTLYPSNAKALAPPELGRAERFLGRLGVGLEHVERRASKLAVSAKVGDLQLVVRVPDVQRYHDRAGAVGFEPLATQDHRDRPCFLPFTSAAVDVHGALKVCCHIYDTTKPDAAPYVMGQLGEQSFRALWTSARFDAFREKVAKADFERLARCQACGHVQPKVQEQVGRARARRLD